MPDSDPAPVDAFAPAPVSAVGRDGVPQFGGFEGIVAITGFPRLADEYRLGGGDLLARARRGVRQKAWVYLFAATPEISVVAALVNGGITGSGFLMVTDLRTGEAIVDSSRQGARPRSTTVPGMGCEPPTGCPGRATRSTARARTSGSPRPWARRWSGGHATPSLGWRST